MYMFTIKIRVLSKKSNSKRNKNIDTRHHIIRQYIKDKIVENDLLQTNNNK